MSGVLARAGVTGNGASPPAGAILEPPVIRRFRDERGSHLRQNDEGQFPNRPYGVAAHALRMPEDERLVPLSVCGEGSWGEFVQSWPWARECCQRICDNGSVMLDTRGRQLGSSLQRPAIGFIQQMRGRE